MEKPELHITDYQLSLISGIVSEKMYKNHRKQIDESGFMNENLAKFLADLFEYHRTIKEFKKNENNTFNI